MEKIIVIPVLPRDQKFDWNKQEYDPGKEIFTYGKLILITDEDIKEKAKEEGNPMMEGGFISCWEYIKSRINQ